MSEKMIKKSRLLTAGLLGMTNDCRTYPVGLRQCRDQWVY